MRVEFLSRSCKLTKHILLCKLVAKIALLQAILRHLGHEKLELIFGAKYVRLKTLLRLLEHFNTILKTSR